jgi:hypothetical protein
MTDYSDYTIEQLQIILRRRLSERQQERLDYLRSRKTLPMKLAHEWRELEAAASRLADAQALARYELAQRGIPV